jgi:hypothetical protein
VETLPLGLYPLGPLNAMTDYKLSDPAGTIGATCLLSSHTDLAI